MIKRASVLALVICLLLVLVNPGLVEAQGGLRVSENTAEVAFPAILNFRLAAESNADITDVRLHYTVQQESFAQVTSEAYIGVVPGTAVNVQWPLDMRRIGGLPPGTGVEYWWTVRDASGGEVETAPVQVSFNDDRYSWQSLTEGELTIYWYGETQSFAGEVMSTAQQALARLIETTGAYLRKPARMYIYSSSRDLQGAMIFPQEWTGGVTFTRYNAIAIGIAPSNLVWGKGAITHELTHLVIGQMTINPYSGLPVWLDEGLAMYSEGLLDPSFTAALQVAIKGNSLISVRSLSSPFSAYPDKAILSYGESFSLVDFLIASYGQGKMLELLNTFAGGSTYDGAFVKVYGFDMDGLNTLWRDYVIKQYQQAGATTAAKTSDQTGVLAKLVRWLISEEELLTQGSV